MELVNFVDSGSLFAQSRGPADGKAVDDEE
jgi:hypothetical protein